MIQAGVLYQIKILQIYFHNPTSIPSNLYQQYGAWVAGFIIRELGIVTGVLMTLVCLNWSFKLFNKTLINHLKFKLLSFILMVFLSSIGGAYLEKIIILYLG